MSEDKKNKIRNSNIGKNTEWDKPLKKVKNGATAPKPSISLRPKEDRRK